MILLSKGRTLPLNKASIPLHAGQGPISIVPSGGNTIFPCAPQCGQRTSTNDNIQQNLLIKFNKYNYYH